MYLVIYFNGHKLKISKISKVDLLQGRNFDLLNSDSRVWSLESFGKLSLMNVFQTFERQVQSCGFN